MSPARKRPEKTRPAAPAPDVVEKQAPSHTEADFLRDLDRAASNQAKRKLAARAARG
jgi:hypothetical protein